MRRFYDATIVQTGAYRLEFACDRVIVDADSVFTEGMMRMAYPGATLRAMGIEVDDPDRLLRGREPDGRGVAGRPGRRNA